MYEQEQFFKERMSSIHDKRNAKEEDFERMQQEEREKVKKTTTGPTNAKEERRLMTSNFIAKLQFTAFCLVPFTHDLQY
jgi:hypothetical protein